MRRISSAIPYSIFPILAARLRWLPATLFVAAVPVFLITASVSWAFNNLGLYEDGFDKYRISSRSGITEDDLRQVAAGLRGYFNSGVEPLSIRTRIFGAERELFNDKEVHHMRDVKRLVWGVYLLAAVSAAYLLANIAVGFASRRSAYLPTLACRAAWGGGVTVAPAHPVRPAGDGGLRRPVPALSPDQLRQRFLAARPPKGLPRAPISSKLLVRRDPLVRAAGDRGGGGPGPGWGRVPDIPPSPRNPFNRPQLTNNKKGQAMPAPENPSQTRRALRPLRSKITYAPWRSTRRKTPSDRSRSLRRNSRPRREAGGGPGRRTARLHRPGRPWRTPRWPAWRVVRSWDSRPQRRSSAGAFQTCGCK